MKQLGIEIVKTMQNYREDIFFVAVLIMVLIVLFDIYQVDMFESGGKKHVNVITIEGMRGQKVDKKKMIAMVRASLLLSLLLQNNF